MSEIGVNIKRAAQLLENGELVAIPTETVYGLAANALNEKATLSIFEAKQRPAFDPLIVHVAKIDEVEKYAIWHEERLRILANSFWPGPLTILLPKKNIVPDIVTSGLEQVAIRIPNHPITLNLLNALSFPLAAPSANPFGYISPTTAQHVNQQLGNKINYILDGGPCSVGLESTIIGFENSDICVYRLGGLAIEDIEKQIGKVSMRLIQSSNPVAPGQLKNHYAPRKPLIIGNLEELVSKYSNQKISTISFGKNKNQKEYILNFNLSPTANINEAALNLFKMMRMADESDAEIILTELLPQTGLGKAINDRLRRAASL